MLLVNLELAKARLREYLEYLSMQGAHDDEKSLGMRAGVAYRRALQSLEPDDNERRALLLGFITPEPANLFS